MSGTDPRQSTQLHIRRRGITTLVVWKSPDLHSTMALSLFTSNRAYG